jgi:hypothetical protein
MIMETWMGVMEKKLDRMESLEKKVDQILELLAPVHAHAEWVDGLRGRLHRLGLVRNTPKIGGAEVGDPPRYLHVPYPAPEPGDGEV